ncbi:MAG TPA: peptide-methionine (R)-S-oxide reductase MsrB [Terriglobales bacterium]|nr:peptide-methionine (R)-S-oxide reductase MsrB [Terriglobales bacterium]
MFDPTDEPVNAKRRAFLIAGAGAMGGIVLWSLKRPHVLAVSAAKPAAPQEVMIVQFSDAGERLKAVRLPKVVKTDEEWKRQLSPNAFDITRRADTEFAFSGQYWNAHENGLYRCICCDNALFRSQAKFDSGTGWPSFWEPIAKENVQTDSDKSLGVERTAVSCTLCDAHLGHVFDDGPEPTGLRYCMNSASLRFVKHG